LYLIHLPDEGLDKPIALDDDKTTYANMPNQTNPERLKLVHHAADKRMGFTCHTAASTHSSMPCVIRWEREGDTTTSCYISMVSEAFGNGVGLSQIDLTGFIFASDRGYWTLALLYGFLMRQGESFCIKKWSLSSSNLCLLVFQALKL
jgi:hypothetical protein